MRPQLAVLTLVSALAIAPACGGGGDDDGGGGGGGGGADAGGVSMPDAGPYTGLGQACEGEGQGDCPDGFQCIALTTGSWCSFECEAGNHAACQVGYTGPGIPACIFGVSTEGDAQPEFVMCGIVCEGIAGTGCTEEKCDGTCPGELECTGAVTDQNMMEVGKACE